MHKKKSSYFGLITIVTVILLLVPAVGLAQDGEGTEAAQCNPVAERLAEEMGIPCQEMLDQAAGHGLGEIMKAWYLSKSLDGFEGDWIALLDRKANEDIGWGQFKMAARLANDSQSAEALLALKQSGLGWGQIKQAQALAAEAELGVSFDQVVAMMNEGLGWGDIRQQLGLPPGPPPWAGGGKDKVKGNSGGNGNGPPPWANSGGKNRP